MMRYALLAVISLSTLISAKASASDKADYTCTYHEVCDEKFVCKPYDGRSEYFLEKQLFSFENIHAQITSSYAVQGAITSNVPHLNGKIVVTISETDAILSNTRNTHPSDETATLNYFGKCEGLN